MSVPSIKTIQTRLGFDLAKSKRIRGLMDGSIDPYTYESVKAWVSKCYNEPDNLSLIMCALNEELGGFGDEAITDEDSWVNSYYGNIVATYVNMGDTYDTTIVLDTRQERFHVVCYGDWVESFERRVKRQIS